MLSSVRLLLKTKIGAFALELTVLLPKGFELGDQILIAACWGGNIRAGHSTSSALTARLALNAVRFQPFPIYLAQQRHFWLHDRCERQHALSLAFSDPSSFH